MTATLGIYLSVYNVFSNLLAILGITAARATDRHSSCFGAPLRRPFFVSVEKRDRPTWPVWGNMLTRPRRAL